MTNSKHHPHWRSEGKEADGSICQLQIRNAEVHLMADHNALPDPAAEMLQGQMQHEPGKFRLLLHGPALESLVVIDQPVEENFDPHEALPARRISRPGQFFERREEKVTSNKGRLHLAKEREANEKAKLVSIPHTTAAHA